LIYTYLIEVDKDIDLIQTSLNLHFFTGSGAAKKMRSHITAFKKLAYNVFSKVGGNRFLPAPYDDDDDGT